MILPPELYLREDVVQLARELLGKVLCTRINGLYTSGMITETEAYAGITDKASHAYGNRRTSRTEVMFRKGGIAYVYLIYGIHSLFNVVTAPEGIPHAILLRAIEPLEGIDIMCERRGREPGKGFADGPGKLSLAMGIHFSHSGLSLLGEQIWIEDRNIPIPEKNILAGPRIGVDYAGEDALRPYRFLYSPMA